MFLFRRPAHVEQRKPLDVDIVALRRARASRRGSMRARIAGVVTLGSFAWVSLVAIANPAVLFERIDPWADHPRRLDPTLGLRDGEALTMVIALVALVAAICVVVVVVTIPERAETVTALGRAAWLDSAVRISMLAVSMAMALTIVQAVTRPVLAACMGAMTFLAGWLTVQSGDRADHTPDLWARIDIDDADRALARLVAVGVRSSPSPLQRWAVGLAASVCMIAALSLLPILAYRALPGANGGPVLGEALALLSVSVFAAMDIGVLAYALVGAHFRLVARDSRLQRWSGPWSWALVLSLPVVAMGFWVHDAPPEAVVALMTWVAILCWGYLAVAWLGHHRGTGPGALPAWSVWRGWVRRRDQARERVVMAESRDTRRTSQER
jgi:hypothetical protein